MSKLKQQHLALLHHILKVEKPSECVKFYTEKFGMKLTAEIQGPKWNRYMLGFCEDTEEKYNRNVTYLELVSPTSESGGPKRMNHGEREGVYWKIAVHMQDVNKAVTKLQHLGVSGAHPGKQFEDVGFLTHLADPDSYAIELLQFTMDNEPKLSLPELGSHPLGQQPRLGLITNRATDINKSLQFYRDLLGMKLICTQDLSKYGFDLYFLAFTDEDPPNPNDLNAVENRPWLYQRPYTVLEIQVYRDGQPRKYQPLGENDYGFMGLGLGCDDVTSLRAHFDDVLPAQQKPYDVTDKHEIFHAPSFTVKDPDGIPLRFIQYKQ